jgi:O-antigen/teichoic acid export membrane protein
LNDTSDYGKSTVVPAEPALGVHEMLTDLIRPANSRGLDSAFVHGIAWTAAVKWLTQAITWGITVLVARLLAPSDYGLVGMAAIYVNLFTLFSEFGIGTTVVTIQDLTENQISQLNSLSLFMGLLGFFISAAAAIPLGKFFRAPDLPAVVIVLSAGFIVSGIRTVPYSLLQKELRFKLLAFIDGAQGIVQALLTLVLALLGFRYWALVLGILSFSVTPTCLTLIKRRHSMAFPRFSSIRRAIHYSRRILIARLAWASYDNSDFIVAGRVLGQSPLGAYTLAWSMAHTPLDKLTNLVNRVTPPVFAKIQNDPVALRRYLRHVTGVMALAVFPATIGIALVAPEFVSVILGAKWAGVVLPLELLALHALFRSNVILLTPLLVVIGEERLVMWNSITAMFVLPICFYIGSRWGTGGIAAGWVVVYPLVQIPLFARVFRRIGLTLSDYLRALWPAVSGCVLMAIAVWAFRTYSTGFLLPYARLGSEIALGIWMYGLTLLLLHRNYCQRIVDFIKEFRSKRNIA